jgi:putative hydrolase of HD superfamily
MKKQSKQILDFLHAAEQLKQELRHSWTSNGRQESVAEHSWRVALMLVICAPYLKEKFDLLKALKLALFHDLGEITVGDQHYLDIGKNKETERDRSQLEERAVHDLACLLGTQEQHIFNLWKEFEGKTSEEAKVVYFLDKLEACIQHNEADILTWTKKEIDSIDEYFDHFNIDDTFLVSLKESVKAETLKKLQTHI